MMLCGLELGMLTPQNSKQYRQDMQEMNSIFRSWRISFSPAAKITCCSIGWVWFVDWNLWKLQKWKMPELYIQVLKIFLANRILPSFGLTFRCVGCGAKDHLVRFSIVPHVFRALLPKRFKEPTQVGCDCKQGEQLWEGRVLQKQQEHSSHDIVLLCHSLNLSSDGQTCHPLCYRRVLMISERYLKMKSKWS